MKKIIRFNTGNPTLPMSFPVDIPETCPLCGTRAYFDQISSNIIKDVETNAVLSWTVTFCCPQCAGIFHIDKSHNRDILTCPTFGKCDLPEEILERYPDFASLYQQAITAESYGLADIAGMGFRKSLEFLIKEYAVRHSPEEKEKILSETLAQTINRIPSPQIQALAKASAWIGNDQTHILTRHPDYGIPDMKRFIQALSHHIVMEQYVSEASTLINPKPNP